MTQFNLHTIKYMKIKTIFLFIILCIAIKVSAQQRDTLLIRFFRWNSEAIHPVTCLNFENVVGITNEYQVTSVDRIDSLNNLLNHLKTSEDEPFTVGCKLYFIHAGKLVKGVCMNESHVLMNGKAFFNDDSVVTFINRLMETTKTVKCNTSYYPDFIGSEYIEGSDSLFSLLRKYLTHYTRKINYTGDMNFYITCRANQKGRNTMVNVRVLKFDKLSKQQERILKSLIKFIKKKIFWKEDNNRTFKDEIDFLLTYHTKRNI